MNGCGATDSLLQQPDIFKLRRHQFFSGARVVEMAPRSSPGSGLPKALLNLCLSTWKNGFKFIDPEINLHFSHGRGCHVVIQFTYHDGMKITI